MGPGSLKPPAITSALCFCSSLDSSNQLAGQLEWKLTILDACLNACLEC